MKCNKQQPTCEACSRHGISCEWEFTGGEPTQDQYFKALKYLIEELGELYLFFHPNDLALLLESARRQPDDQKAFLWAMIDALASLGALYLEDSQLSQNCYESARKKLDSLASNHIEEFIGRTILVRPLTHKTRASSFVTNCFIQATVAMHIPTRYKGYRPHRVNAYSVLEARIFVDTASSIARGIRLQVLDLASDEELEKSILRVAVLWDGINLPKFVKILRETWRRVWCHLIIADHDTSKALRRNFLAISTVLDTKIEYPSLFDRNACSNEQVHLDRAGTNSMCRSSPVVIVFVSLKTLMSFLNRLRR